MRTEIQELYQQVILDHNKNPRNFRKIEQADFAAEGFNPLCGDHLNIYLKLNDGKIDDLSFDGNGCAISKASASIMTTLLKGKTVEEADQIFEEFHSLITCDHDCDCSIDKVGKLAVFCGVREFPTRVKCASLAWHTLHNALHSQSSSTKTE